MSTGPRVPTGIDGLDEILGGGLPGYGMYLVKGDSGTGKTTLGLQFVREGVRRGEPAVYITVFESEQDIERAARSHGWSLEGVMIHELGGLESGRAEEAPYTLFHPSEVELGALTRAIIAATAGLSAPRVVIDTVCELRILSGGSLRYRRQLLALAQTFAAHEATVLLLDEDVGEPAMQMPIENLARGVVRLDLLWPEIGDARRRLCVVKARDIAFRGGYHDVTLDAAGITVFPRLRLRDVSERLEHATASTGLTELDALLGGGLDRSAATLLMGPTGSGKSVLASQIAAAAAARGEHVGMFLFDEGIDAVLARADGLQMGLREHVTQGRITLQRIDPGEIAPWKFAQIVLELVERERARLITIDSIGGYLHAMPDERALDLVLHELFGCLSQLGVMTVGTLLRHGFLGERVPSGLDISYLSDTVVLLGLFEAGGEMRRAVSVLKRRRGPHAQSICELQLGPGGLRVGGRLRGLAGVLTGVPTQLGAGGRLGDDDEPAEP